MEPGHAIGVRQTAVSAYERSMHRLSRLEQPLANDYPTPLPDISAERFDCDRLNALFDQIRASDPRVHRVLGVPASKVGAWRRGFEPILRRFRKPLYETEQSV